MQRGHFSPKSPECLPDGSGGHIRSDRTAARPVGQSPTATNAHNPVTSERGGLSPYRAVEPWLLLHKRLTKQKMWLPVPDYRHFQQFKTGCSFYSLRVISLRIGTGGGLLWVRWWTFGFHKMRGISWLADNLLASQEGLCCVELVS
jgi:hypothetical protein